MANHTLAVTIAPSVALTAEIVATGPQGLTGPTFVVDVTSAPYSARGNGTTDDTTAIQAAITACQVAGGGVVLFPATVGNVGYKTSSTLNITADGVVLQGTGRGQLCIKYTGTGSAIQFGTSGTYVYRCGMQGVRVTDSSGTGTVGVDLFCRESVFRDVMIHQGFTTAQLRLNGTSSPAAGCWSTRFLHCFFHSGAGDGTQIGYQANAAIFEDCHWTSCTGDHVWIPYGNGVKFIGCQFENAGTGYEIHVTDRSGAFTAAQTLGLMIDDCYFELKSAAASRALKIDGTTSCRFSFTNNYVYGFATATHAVQAGPSSGSARGDLQGNFLHGITTAHCLADAATARVFVGDHPGQSGTWPAGSALTLLDNTGGGRGTSMNQSDQELLITGKLHVTGVIQNDGTVIPRVATIATSATPTITVTSTDVYIITALAVAITSVTSSGTPQNGQRLNVAITDNGTARALAWGASFEASGTVALPTTTVISTRLDTEFIWNTATSKWRCVRVA